MHLIVCVVFLMGWFFDHVGVRKTCVGPCAVVTHAYHYIAYFAVQALSNKPDCACFFFKWVGSSTPWVYARLVSVLASSWHCRQACVPLHRVLSRPLRRMPVELPPVRQVPKNESDRNEMRLNLCNVKFGLTYILGLLGLGYGVSVFLKRCICPRMF